MAGILLHFASTTRRCPTGFFLLHDFEYKLQITPELHKMEKNQITPELHHQNATKSKLKIKLHQNYTPKNQQISEFFKDFQRFSVIFLKISEKKSSYKGKKQVFVQNKITPELHTKRVV